MNGKMTMLHQFTKKVLSNYRPVFLHPVWSKIFERLIYNSVYKHISDKNVTQSV